MGHKTSRTVVVVALGALTLAAIFVVVRPSQPAITHNYLADINAEALATPPEERAWPKLYTANLVLEPVPKFMSSRFWPFATDFNGKTSPTDEQWSQTREFILANQESIAALRAAAAMPVLGIVVSDVLDQEYAQASALARGYTFTPEIPSENPPWHMVILPHLSELRRAAELLATDALVAAEVGADQRALDDVIAILGTARLGSQGPSLVEQLTAVKLETNAHKVIRDWLAQKPNTPDDAVLSDLAGVLQTLESQEPIATLDGARLSVLDTIQRTYSSRGRMTRTGATYLADLYMWDSTFLDKWQYSNQAAPRDDVLTMLDRFIAAGEQDIATPHWQRQGWAIGALHSSMPWEDLRYKYAAITAGLGSFRSVANQSERLRQRRAASRAIVALCRHRLRHGTFPATLEAIDTDLLDQPPLDRFTGEPLRWLVTDTEAVLYSIGNDRDDDTGTPIDDPERLIWLPPGDTRSGPGGLQDGDWVLWRVQLTNPDSE